MAKGSNLLGGGSFGSAGLLHGVLEYLAEAAGDVLVLELERQRLERHLSFGKVLALENVGVFRVAHRLQRDFCKFTVPISIYKK